MKWLRAVSAILLALPLLIFGGSYFFSSDEPLAAEGISPASTAGLDLLQSMRDGGLMAAVAGSHVLVALLLGVPRTRFFGALMQLPMTLGIVAFHATMFLEGIGPAIAMLLLNIGALADKERLLHLVGRTPTES